MPWKRIGHDDYVSPSGKHWTLAQIRAYLAKTKGKGETKAMLPDDIDELDLEDDTDFYTADEVEAELERVGTLAYHKGLEAGRLELRTHLKALSECNGSTDAVVAYLRKAHGWNESDHKRDHGRFSSTGGSDGVSDSGAGGSTRGAARDGLRDGSGGDSAASHGGTQHSGASAGSTGDTTETRIRSLAARIREVPAAVAGKVKSWLQGKYEKLSKRYGPTGAKAVLGAIVLMLPAPIPGSSLLPIAVAEAVRGIRSLVGSAQKAMPDLSDEQAHALAKEALHDLYDEMGEEFDGSAVGDNPVLGGSGDSTGGDGSADAEVGGADSGTGEGVDAPDETQDAVARAALDALGITDEENDDEPLVKAWDEAKHNRDHGKFSSQPGAKGGTSSGGSPAHSAPHADDSGSRAFDHTKPHEGGLSHLGSERERATAGKKTWDEQAAATEKVMDTARQHVEAHLARGGRVTMWVDGKAVPIVKMTNGMMEDAKGQRWGMLPLLMAKPGTPEGLQFHKIAPQPPPLPSVAGGIAQQKQATTRKQPASATHPGEAPEVRSEKNYGALAKKLLSGRSELKLLGGDLKPHTITDGASLKEFFDKGGKLPDSAFEKVAERVPVATPAAKNALLSVHLWVGAQADKHADRVAAHFGISREKAHALLVDAIRKVAGHAAKTGGKVGSFTLRDKRTGKTATLAPKVGKALEIDDTPDERELLAAAVEYAEACLADGTDPEEGLGRLAALSDDPDEMATVLKGFDPNEKRDEGGRWTEGGAGKSNGSKPLETKRRPRQQSGRFSGEQNKLLTAALAGDKTAWGALADHLAENGHPDAGAVLSEFATDRHPDADVVLTHGENSGIGSSDVKPGHYRYYLVPFKGHTNHVLVGRAADGTPFYAAYTEPNAPVQKAFDEQKHPRDDHGRFVSKEAIHAAKTDSAKADELRKRVTNPEQRKKLESALSGETDLGRTARGEKKEATKQKREKVQASRAEAKRLAYKLLNSQGEPGDYAALIPHLSALSGKELSHVRLMLGASFGGERGVEARRQKLIDYARNAGVEAKMEQEGFSEEEKQAQRDVMQQMAGKKEDAPKQSPATDLARAPAASDTPAPKQETAPVTNTAGAPAQPLTTRAFEGRADDEAPSEEEFAAASGKKQEAAPQPAPAPEPQAPAKEKKPRTLKPRLGRPGGGERSNEGGAFAVSKLATLAQKAPDAVTKDREGNRTTQFPAGEPEKQAKRLAPAIVGAMKELKLDADFSDGIVPLGALAQEVRNAAPDATDRDILAALSHMRKTRQIEGQPLNEVAKLEDRKSGAHPLGGGMDTATLWENGKAIHFFALPRT